jgi:hypothetical protein
MLTAVHVPIVDQYLSDLVKVTDDVRRTGRTAAPQEITYGG